MSTNSRYRICPLCEATCALEIEINGRDVVSVRGDAADLFSEGYICPKGAALKELHHDPDRLRVPWIRHVDGWREATWDEAFEHINEHLPPIRERRGNNAIGVYLGNPTVHNLALTLYAPALVRALGTRNVFSASTVDQFPKQLACALMFGTGLSVPVPDIDRCQYLMILGGNPLVSNGSLMTAPNIGARLRRMRQRGGKIVVIDPRRTKTADAADEHHFIRPGTDAYFLFGIVHTLFEDELIRPGRLADWTNGLERVRELAREFSPESVSPRCGIDAPTIRRLAREIAAAPAAAVYGRIGTCTQEFGTIASWLPEVIHVLTGNLDRPGGAMFTRPAHGPGNTKGRPGTGRGAKFGRWKSRVRGIDEIFGELPVACLAEEIETPGDDQIRAMITIAGNPVLSTPNEARLSRALDSLEFMVSIDVYLNETTRHANVILPGPSPLETSHYDLAFSQLAIRDCARYSAPVLDKPDGQPEEWETLLRLVGVLSGMGSKPDIEFLDQMVVTAMIQRESKEPESIIHRKDPEEILAALVPRTGPDRILDLLIRTGPYGEGFGSDADGLSLAVLEANPHGIDLGPMKPRIPEVLRTPTGKIELAPDRIVADVARLRRSLNHANGGMVLIGRRDLRSNNSWMHNIPLLVNGKPRCTLQIHPLDAERLELVPGDLAKVESDTGSVVVPVELCDSIMPGVVSIPHGWGHADVGVRLSVAREHAGVNSNLLASTDMFDQPSGTAVLNGIPVEIRRMQP
jgi:anaerobic selenocysteine-containing dehydrogenase